MVLSSAMAPRFSIIVLFIVLGSLDSAAVAQVKPGTEDSTKDLYKVRREFNVMIPMRDGIKLAADIVRPDTAGRFPVIVTRTPYGKVSKEASKQAEYFAGHGYVYVNQDVRGRFDSEGEFEILVNEGRDGYDTIEWLAGQPWSDGNVGTFGGSYVAWDQWLAAELQPPHLRAMVVQSTPPDIYLTVWWRGAFQFNTLFWCILLDGRVNQDLAAIDPDPTLHLPVLTMDQATGRHLDKTFRAWIEHPFFDDFWKRQAYAEQLSRVNVPVLHVDGWYDFRDVSATLRNYNAMLREGGSAAARKNQRVIIGPWQHGGYDQRKIGDIDFGADSLLDRKSIYLDWYNCHLKNKNCDRVAAMAPVRIFVMGENRWRDEQEWPLSRAQATNYFFHSGGHANSSSGDGRLTRESPASEAADHFTYDPRDANVLEMQPEDAFTGDQRKAEARQDMLVFSSDSLDTPVEVSGRIHVKFWAASSAPDTDWVARLIDVHPDGSAQRLSDDIVRASYHGVSGSEYVRSPGDFERLAAGAAREYTLDLWDISHVFLQGHRIRVEIASAYLPVFARNLNTGDNNLTTTAIRNAEQTVFHDSARPSHITLPIVPR